MMIVYRIIISFEIIILRTILVRKASRLAVIFNLIWILFSLIFIN